MKHLIILFISARLGAVCDGQNIVSVYATLEGKQYSQYQRDSIESLGNFIATKSTRQSNDTVFRAIYYYDKALLLSVFQRRHQDKPLPKLILKSITGEEVNSDKLKGKIVMINFWSTSCGPCLEEIPQLNKLKEKYDKDVHFIAIAPDKKKDIQYIKEK
jgi:thiol-disulfide isomerase/thioredoxin